MVRSSTEKNATLADGFSITRHGQKKTTRWGDLNSISRRNLI